MGKHMKEKRNDMRLDVISGDVAKINFDIVSVKNISPTGIYVIVDDITKYKVNTYVIVDLFLPEKLHAEYGSIPIKGKITRITWAQLKDKKLGLAIKFEYTDKNSMKQVVESLIHYIKNKQIVSVSKRILEEYGKTSHDEY